MASIFIRLGILFSAFSTLHGDPLMKRAMWSPQSDETGKRFRETVEQVVQKAPHKRSALEATRAAFRPSVPPLLLGGVKKIEGAATTCVANHDQIQKRFPNLYGSPLVDLVPEDTSPAATRAPLRVGCVLSGGQAAGGHNCICGIYDYVHTHFPGSSVYGFLGGPKGVMENQYKILDTTTIDAHRNSGGFTMLASGRDKIETPEQFEMATNTAKLNDLDGLVVIGGALARPARGALDGHPPGGTLSILTGVPSSLLSPLAPRLAPLKTPPASLPPLPSPPAFCSQVTTPTRTRASSPSTTARRGSRPRWWAFRRPSTATSRTSTARRPLASTRPPSSTLSSSATS
jgi:hypothetical protein